MGDALLSHVSQPKFSRKIWGQETFGDYSMHFSPPNSPKILGRETLLHEITRDLKFLGNFGTVRPKFSRKFWIDFVLLSRVKFLGNFFHTKFSEKFGTGALGVKFLGHFVHTKFPNKFGTGALGLSCEISGKFRGPKFPGNFRSYLATVCCVFCSKILREFWDEKRFFARLQETSNF